MAKEGERLEDQITSSSARGSREADKKIRTLQEEGRLPRGLILVAILEGEDNPLGLRGFRQEILERLKGRIDAELYARSAAALLEAVRKPTIPSRTVSNIAHFEDFTRQIENLIQTGFHHLVSGGSVTEYRDSFRYKDQPSQFAGRFDIPLAVENRVGLQEQCELLGISWRERLKIQLRNRSVLNPSFDAKPKQVWGQDGGRHSENAFFSSRKFDEDERAMDLLHVMALIRREPGILKRGRLTVVGSPLITVGTYRVLGDVAYPQIASKTNHPEGIGAFETTSHFAPTKRAFISTFGVEK